MLFRYSFFLCGLAWAASAQNIGSSLAVQVEDSQGLAVRGAQVTVRSEQTGAKQEAASSMAGQARFASLAPGAYKVTVSRDGFAEAVIEDLALVIGQERSVRVTLRPEEARQSITVSGEAISTVQTESGSNSAGFSLDQMQNLPMLGGGTGRNFRTQAYLAPGVAPSTAAHRPFAVSGSRNRNNNYLIDSSDFNEAEGGLLMGRGASEQLISTEAIEGMQVITHNFKAEYGRQSGSIMSIVTKRGSNDWHGLAFNYLRNDALDARNTFDIAKPPLRANQFGFNIGGPVFRNRTFFFVNNEWSIRRATNASTVQTLTPAQKSTAAPAVSALAAMYPDPNVPGTNLFRSSVPTAVDQWSGVFRVDHEFNVQHRVFFRGTLLDSTNKGVSGASFARYASNIGPKAYLFQHAWTPGAAMLNEARVSYTRFDLNDDFIDPVALGDPSRNGSVGTVSTTGLSALGHFAFMQRQTAQNTYQASDDLNWFRGAHSVKTGFSLRRLQLNSGVFTPGFTGVARFLNVNDFLAGRPASYSRNIGNPYIGLRTTETNLYVQDDWRVHPRLTLNLGLRYEYNAVPNEVDGLIQDRYRYQPDRNNFAPRFGFAYRADRDGTTVVRGGYGIYYNVLELSFVGLARFNPPLISSLAAAQPAFPNLLAGASQSIPSGLVIPDAGLRQPYSQHLNFAVERQLWNPRTSFTAAYVGTLGRKLPRISRPNGGDALAQNLRPDSSVGVVNVLETAVTSSYHAMQLSWNTTTHGLMMRTSYTWSKFIDEVSDFPTGNQNLAREILPLDERNWRLNRGPSDFDMRHTFTVAWSYELPWMKRNRLLGGWQAQGITTLYSGRPYSLFSGTDNPQGSNSNRILDLDGGLVRNGGGARRSIDLGAGFTKAMLTPARGALGTIGRNTERGDSLVSWNASLFKSFAITERMKLQFRAEAFNFTNTVNYNPPDGVLSSPNFGQALTANDPRQAQLALRFTF